ncbi:MAG TPA: HWE histidine kinase domain-containing protein [Microvirga sp.]|jgi:PAS domain S-box-containing protein|nr:HWE histidine kinase domain-containing protein [Microvirga sp.]
MDPVPATILVVDDTEAIRYAKARTLRRAGYHVLEASEGRQALTIATEARPALVLLDVKLPDISGIEVCRILKQEQPDILVLQMSASFVESQDRMRGLDNGADTYLVEPVEPGELLASVRALLRMREANEALRASEDRYRLIVESATDYAIFTTDLDGRVTSWNAGAQNVLGFEEPEILGEDARVIWTAEDRAAGAPEAEMRGAREEGRAEDERWHVRKDGSQFFAHGLLMPLKGPDRALQGYLKILRDRTERRRTEERQELLIRELHHRVRNTLATVQAVANSTIRSARSMEDFSDAFLGRINALARTHALLTEDYWQAASLRELLASQLGPYLDGRERQLTLDGPPVELPSEVAVPVSMAIHELTTNAAKHGSLSVEGGHLAVTWSLRTDGGRRLVRLEWRERNGPRVAPPTREGFGTRLLERVLSTQAQAEVKVSYDPEGLTFAADIPVPPGPDGEPRPAA